MKSKETYRTKYAVMPVEHSLPARRRTSERQSGVPGPPFPHAGELVTPPLPPRSSSTSHIDRLVTGESGAVPRRSESPLVPRRGRTASGSEVFHDAMEPPAAPGAPRDATHTAAAQAATQAAAAQGAAGAQALAGSQGGLRSRAASVSEEKQKSRAERQEALMMERVVHQINQTEKHLIEAA